MKRLSYYLVLIAFLVLVSSESKAQRLFHISRSINKNWVCYDVVQKNNRLDLNNPIHVYWHNNSDNPGHENELSFFQRKMAYGYKILSKGNNEATVRLTAYKDRSMKICMHKGKWMATAMINGKNCQLKEIQVKTKEGNSLKVLYIKLLGTCLSDGTSQVERIDNK